MENSLILPKTNKKTGKPYLSYSSITSFKRNKKEWAERYLYDKPFQPNHWTEFGSKVGEALEHNNFQEFSKEEQRVLKATPRLDEFETMIVWDLGDFEIVGYIDTNTSDRNHLIDYKTGGPGKQEQYDDPDYWQLAIYAGACRQAGFKVKTAEVVFLERIGNPFKGYPLKLKEVPPLIIPQDIELVRINRLREELYHWAEQISNFTKEWKEMISE